MPERNELYWDTTADHYLRDTRISTRDFHYGPLLPGDEELGLLPPSLKGLRCLELGCGAGQNSIYLARRGAQCMALDVADKMLEHGRELAKAAGVAVDFRRGDMDRLPVADLGRFDLVHSTYALPFADDPADVIGDCSRLLAPGGCLLLTTGHPAYAGDWVEVGEGEAGLLLHSYFDPPEDRREPQDGHQGAVSRAYPPSVVAEWITDAGLRIDRFLEPRPLVIPLMTEEEIRARVPYESDDWRELYEVLSAVPIVAIFKCSKSSAGR